jgi:hypothetical protein
MFERLKVDLSIESGKDDCLESVLNDRINDLYGFIYALANAVSPLIGSAIQESVNTPFLFDVVFLIDIILALSVLHFNCGFDVFSENHRFEKKLERLI